MSEADLTPDEEVVRLRKELKRAQREIRQLKTVARTSEELASQSKSAMLVANDELKLTIEQLRGMTTSLQEATRAAEEASEAKSRFLAAMSHEIRTPMNGVIGSLELMSGLDLPQEVSELATLMDDSARTLLQLINDILDFAKVEAGSLVLESIEFSLRDCIDAVVAQEMHVADKKGLKLLTDIGQDVPHMVRGDVLRLRQVVTNLVSNAVKFTPEGSVRVRVRNLGAETESRLAFEVIDTGIGIDSQGLDRIFAPFTQADSSTTRLFGGTGLGLSISSGLVKLMGGKLTAESRLGAGSTFRFEITLERVASEEVAACLPKRAARELSQFDARVLVVDDTPINRVIASRMLERMGCSVECAKDGREALEAVSEGEFDLVLMDCSMPIMDGYQATEAIRELPEPRRSIKIVALTAHALAGFREKCLTAGMNDYLSKPVQIRELEGVLSRMLNEDAVPEQGQAG